MRILSCSSVKPDLSIPVVKLESHDLQSPTRVKNPCNVSKLCPSSNLFITTGKPGQVKNLMEKLEIFTAPVSAFSH